jgi:ribosomal-protein-alanine N-acetyltransferase
VTPESLARTYAAAFGGERAWTAAEFAALLDQPGIILCGDARSFAMGRVVLDEAEVLTLATHPEFRRQGLARAALKDLILGTASAQARRLFLEVAEDNLAARQLYTSLGFSQIGRRPGYYARKNGPRISALIMEKALPGV